MGNPIDDTPEGIAAMRAANENNLPANPPEEVREIHITSVVMPGHVRAEPVDGCALPGDEDDSPGQEAHEEVEAGHEYDEPHNHDGSTPHSHEQPMGGLVSMIASALGMGPRPPQESLTPEERADRMLLGLLKGAEYRTSGLIKVAEKSLDDVGKIIRILPAFDRRVVLTGVREWLNSLEGKLDQMEENDLETRLAQSIRDVKKAENLKPIHEDPAVQPEDNATR
jgi:hypothetical protein